MDFKKLMEEKNYTHHKIIFIGKTKAVILNIQNGGKNMPFLQPFTYTEINLNIIYMATDYSMYKARAGSKLKGAQRSFILGGKTADCPRERSQGSIEWFGRNTDFNSAWKLSSNKGWLPTEYSRWQKLHDCSRFFYFLFFYSFFPTNSKRDFEGNSHEHTICVFRDAWSHNSVPTQIFSQTGYISP